MKKVLSAFVAGLLCLTMVFGLYRLRRADKQPLLDSYNKAAEAFNELADLCERQYG